MGGYFMYICIHKLRDWKYYKEKSIVLNGWWRKNTFNTPPPTSTIFLELPSTTYACLCHWHLDNKLSSTFYLFNWHLQVQWFLQHCLKIWLIISSSSPSSAVTSSWCYRKRELFTLLILLWILQIVMIFV